LLARSIAGFNGSCFAVKEREQKLVRKNGRQGGRKEKRGRENPAEINS